MVLINDYTKNGIEIVLHNFENGLCSIMAYPIAAQTDYERFGIERGKKFCLDINFDNLDDAKTAFQELVNGNKGIIDFKDNFWDPRDVQYI